MNEAFLGLMIVNVLAVLSVWIKGYFNYKAKKAEAKKAKIDNTQNKTKNPNQIPGGSATCIRNGKAIIKMVTQIEFMQKQMDDLKADTEKNFDTVYRELRRK